MILRSKKYFVCKSLFAVFIFIILSNFKKIDYTVKTKVINNKTFYFAVPDSFCERLDLSEKKVIKFVKCYELEMEEEQNLEFFSETIIFSYEEYSDKIQNLTEESFSKVRKTIYQKMMNENLKSKDNSVFDKKAETKVYLFKKQHIFEIKSYDFENNKYLLYESEIFLNKTYFKVNWTQQLSKNEKFIKKDRFYDLLKENIYINNEKNILYIFPTRQVILPLPKFGNFLNYRDVEKVNTQKMHGYFVNVSKNNYSILRIIILNFKMDREQIIKNNQKKNIEHIKYKDMEFIKILTDGAVSYDTYINLLGGISLNLSLTVDKKDKNGLKNLYNYSQDLINKNL